MKIIFTILIIFCGFSIKAQQNNLVYNPKTDAQKQLDSAITLAQQQHKNIFVQVGGNWCRWCLMMHNFYTSDKQIDSMMQTDYVVVLINYSKDNKNPEIMSKLGYPQRFGFPVIVILDENGNRIHTQNSLYLERTDVEGYSKERFMDFLKSWNKEALNPENYK